MASSVGKMNRPADGLPLLPTHSYQSYTMSAPLSQDASRKSSFSATGGDLDKKDLDNTEHIEELAGVRTEYDDSIEDAPPSRAVWLITFTVAMGGFLFGKHASGAITYFNIKCSG